MIANVADPLGRQFKTYQLLTAGIYHPCDVPIGLIGALLLFAEVESVSCEKAVDSA